MEECANESQHLCFCITEFLISVGDRMERFFVELKKNVRNNVLVDLKEDGGHWEDIKCLIHYAITIDTTYAQAAKRREGTNPRSNAMQPNGLVSYEPKDGQETRWSPSCPSNFYNKEETPKEHITLFRSITM